MGDNTRSSHTTHSRNPRLSCLYDHHSKDHKHSPKGTRCPRARSERLGSSSRGLLVMNLAEFGTRRLHCPFRFSQPARRFVFRRHSCHRSRCFCFSQIREPTPTLVRRCWFEAVSRRLAGNSEVFDSRHSLQSLLIIIRCSMLASRYASLGSENSLARVV